jgi:protein-disulfide isomerase
MREIWLGLVVILTLFGVSPASAQTPAAPKAALAVSPDDRILGNPNAPITIIEYASLTCPHCRHFETEVLPTLKKKWIDTGKARLIMRDYPLDEPALRAAMVARCAPPDRFYPFVETLFDDQETWAMAPDPQAELEKLALLGGMTKAQFTGCLANKKMENEVIGSRLAATQQLGVDATPTFFINGTKFDGDPTIEAFNELLTGLSPKS